MNVQCRAIFEENIVMIYVHDGSKRLKKTNIQLQHLLVNLWQLATSKLALIAR